MDPFTKKRTHERVRENHFGSANVYAEMASEFGRRVAWAEKEGLPRDMAIEACREHFKIVGKAMQDLADFCADEMKKGVERGEG